MYTDGRTVLSELDNRDPDVADEHTVTETLEGVFLQWA